jgi:hypothetical protein
MLLLSTTLRALQRTVFIAEFKRRKDWGHGRMEGKERK